MKRLRKTPEIANYILQNAQFSAAIYFAMVSLGHVEDFDIIKTNGFLPGFVGKSPTRLPNKKISILGLTVNTQMEVVDTCRINITSK